MRVFPWFIVMRGYIVRFNVGSFTRATHVSIPVVRDGVLIIITALRIVDYSMSTLTAMPHMPFTHVCRTGTRRSELQPRVD